MSEDLISNQTDERDLAVTELPADEDAISENTEEQGPNSRLDPQLTDVDPEKFRNPAIK